MITQKEICRAVGLSPMTVHKYIHGKRVSLKTKKKLDRFLERKQYRPNLTARSLVLRKTNIIGLLVPSFSFWFYPEIIQTLQIEFRKEGYNIILCLSSEDPVREKEELNLLLSIPVDGLIISPTNNMLSKANCKMLKREKMPFIMLDRYFSDIMVPFVATNSYGGSKEIVQHLINLGHRDIAHIGGPEQNSFSRDLLRGYRSALKNNKLAINEDMIFSGPISLEGGYNTMKRILTMRKRPTAVQALNDLVAYGAILAAKEKNLNVPDDIAIVGYSNINFIVPPEVPITTITEPVEELSNAAATMLLSGIKGKGKQTAKRFIDGKLIIRESSVKGMAE